MSPVRPKEFGVPLQDFLVDVAKRTDVFSKRDIMLIFMGAPAMMHAANDGNPRFDTVFISPNRDATYIQTLQHLRRQRSDNNEPRVTNFVPTSV